MTDPPDRTWALVLAGGTARRFGGLKQFERAGGQRLVDRVVAAARAACDGVTLVLPAGPVWDGPAVDAVVAGGVHQSDSLRAGLATVPPDADVVVVADPAHPLTSTALIGRVVAAVRAGADGAVPVLPLLEVVQRVADGRVTATLPKAGLVLTQTPQAFRTAALRAAHADRPRPVENSGLLVERGYRVVTVPGDPANLHVATPEDLAVVEAITMGDGRAHPTRRTPSS